MLPPVREGWLYSFACFGVTEGWLATAWTETKWGGHIQSCQGHGWAVELRGRPQWDLKGNLGKQPSSREPAADCHFRKRLAVPACQRCTRQEIEHCSQSPAAGEQGVEFPLSVWRGLFVTREIKAQGREKGLSGDTPHTVPLRTDSIGNLFWVLSPLLPLKESSVKRMKINLILLTRRGWREPQTRYWKTKTGSFPRDTFICASPPHSPSSLTVLFSLPCCPSSLQAAHAVAAKISPFHKVKRATEANNVANTKQRTEEKVLSP